MTLEGIGLKFATRRVSWVFFSAARHASDFLINTNRNIFDYYVSCLSFIGLIFFSSSFCRCTLTCVTSEIVPRKEVCFSWRSLVSAKPVLAKSTTHL